MYLIAPQFLTAVRNSADPDSRPGLILVQSSKAGETSFTNYDDVNYREMQYHYWVLCTGITGQYETPINAPMRFYYRVSYGRQPTGSLSRSCIVCIIGVVYCTVITVHMTLYANLTTF